MNINVSDLRSFKNLSSSIKGNNILPVLEYIKIGDGRIVKSILSAFVEFKCNDADTKMLVDEKLLSIKTGSAQSTSINFSKKGNKITMTDTITPTTFQSPDFDAFPVIPEPTSERYAVSENFMRVIGKAQHFPLQYNPEQPSWMSFLMIGEGHICTSDGHALFMEPIEESFELVLDKRHAQVISKMPIKEYAFSDKYMFFYTDNATIGFSKQEIGFTNIIKYGDIGASTMEFFASASDFQRFNEECSQSSKFPWVEVANGKISMNDSDLDVYLERSLESVKPSQTFTYNAATMNRILNVVDGDEIQFYKGERWYWIKCPEQKSTMLIMLLQTR